MGTNKKIPSPTQIIQLLPFKKKITIALPPPKNNLNYLKNQHPPPPTKKNKPP